MEIEIIISLVVFAFFAGVIDAAVGGGGLIQIPAIMGSLRIYSLLRSLAPINSRPFVAPLLRHFPTCVR